MSYVIQLDVFEKAVINAHKLLPPKQPTKAQSTPQSPKIPETLDNIAFLKKVLEQVLGF